MICCELFWYFFQCNGYLIQSLSCRNISKLEMCVKNNKESTFRLKKISEEPFEIFFKDVPAGNKKIYIYIWRARS